MQKSILTMTKREVELERIKLINAGLLEDSAYKLGQMIKTTNKLKRGMRGKVR